MCAIGNERPFPWFYKGRRRIVGLEEQLNRIAGTTTPIRVLVVEDFHMVAEMIARILGDEADLSVVAVVDSVTSAHLALEHNAVDVVLMDYKLPDGSGLDAAKEVRRTYPNTKVVIVTGTDDDRLFKEALGAGCSGWLLKTEHANSLPLAVRAAHAGSTAVSPEMLSALIESSGKPAHPDELSPRELEILAMVARGQGNDEIAEQLLLSTHTVRNHIQASLEKLDAHSKLEAVMEANRLGLIQIGRQ